jgi:hypothetical protein
MSDTVLSILLRPNRLPLYHHASVISKKHLSTHLYAINPCPADVAGKLISRTDIQHFCYCTTQNCKPRQSSLGNELLREVVGWNMNRPVDEFLSSLDTATLLHYNLICFKTDECHQVSFCAWKGAPNEEQTAVPLYATKSDDKVHAFLTSKLASTDQIHGRVALTRTHWKCGGVGPMPVQTVWRRKRSDVPVESKITMDFW